MNGPLLPGWVARGRVTAMIPVRLLLRRFCLPVKILFDHTLPFALAHGGAQTQIEKTMLAVERAGAEVEHLRWWDGRQTADLIHLFAPADPGYLRLARQKKLPVVLTSLMGGDLQLSPGRLRRKSWKLRLFAKTPGLGGINGLLPWQGFHLCTVNHVSLAAEKRILCDTYGVPADKVALVPYGMSDSYLQAQPSQRTGDFLISTGTITERKRPVEMARLALAARVPILFVGKPYHEQDPYWLEFRSLIDERFVRYLPHVAGEAQMIELYRSARGFTLGSDTENWCLSAHEAACCGLPCLLRAQPWSLERFGAEARYLSDDPKKDVSILRQFHEESPTLPVPRVKQWSWWDVGEQLTEVYRRILG